MSDKTRTRRFPAALAVVALAVAGACGGSGGGAADDDGRLRLVATVSPITNIVQNVAGDRARVVGIVPEGQNSHEFEPAPSVARDFARADAVFVNGLNLELPSIELAEPNVREGVPIVKLAEQTITPEEYIFDFSFPREGGDPNPHLWTNPPYAKRYAEIVKDTLTRLDPEGTATYQSNYDRFAARIDQLDTAVKAATATVPRERRKLLTYHDSFPYFARTYGWDVVGAIQPSDFSDPTPREVARIIEQVRREKVPAIFGSEVFPSPVLEQIAREAGARYVDDLRDDDLPGDPGDPNHSYLGLMVFDYETIVEALGGDASAFDGIDTRNVAGDGAAEYRR